jgi:hypothetical protein
MRDVMERAESTMPWLIWTYGLTHDKWWPFWNSTRVLGYCRIQMSCCICGKREVAKLRLPHFGDIPDRGHHPERLRFMSEHVHPERPPVMTWVLPLKNMNAVQMFGGLDLDALAMRLQADILAGVPRAQREKLKRRFFGLPRPGAADELERLAPSNWPEGPTDNES